MSEKMVSVPADLLTQACLLIGKLPCEHGAHVYVQLLAAKAEEREPAIVTDLRKEG